MYVFGEAGAKRTTESLRRRTPHRAAPRGINEANHARPPFTPDRDRRSPARDFGHGRTTNPVHRFVDGASCFVDVSRCFVDRRPRRQDDAGERFAGP